MAKTLIAGFMALVAISSLQISAVAAQEAGDEQKPAERRGMGPGKGMMGMGVKGMDEDGDGKVSKSEFLQGHEEMFDRMDQDGDGMLEDTEMKQMRGMGRGMMHRHP